MWSPASISDPPSCVTAVRSRTSGAVRWSQRDQLPAPGFFHQVAFDPVRMSMYGSRGNLNMGRRSASKGDLTGGMTQHYARSEVVHGGGNGYDPYMDGYNTYTFSKSSMGGMAGGMAGGGMSGMTMSNMGGGMSGGTMGSMGGGMAKGMRYEFTLCFIC